MNIFKVGFQEILYFDPCRVSASFDGGKRGRQCGSGLHIEIQTRDRWVRVLEEGVYLEDTTSTTAEVVAMASLVERVDQLLQKIQELKSVGSFIENPFFWDDSPQGNGREKRRRQY